MGFLVTAGGKTFSVWRGRGSDETDFVRDAFIRHDDSWLYG